MSAHVCHAVGCETRCKPEFLMCAPHWRMVPIQTQRAVYAAYVPGQCDLDPYPSQEWFDAAFAAIESVAVKEGFRSEPIESNPAQDGTDTEPCETCGGSGVIDLGPGNPPSWPCPDCSGAQR